MDRGYDDKVIELLKDYVDIETVCPEKGIGLSTPREPIRIEKHGSANRIVQLKSNIDYTSQMTEFADEFLPGINDVDGFILKSRSPSCGIKNVNVYEILKHKRTNDTKINICLTVFEKYKDKLSGNEIKFFENLIHSFYNNKIPFSSIIVALQMYAVRFDDTDLLIQKLIIDH